MEAFVAGLRDESARSSYAAVLAAVESGIVDGPLTDLLGTFLEIALSTGRVRSRLGLMAEESVRRVFERTSRGAALAASAEEVSRALAPLVGQTIEEIRIALVRPGTYRLVVETEQCRISVGLAPGAAHVESVEVNP